LNRNPILKALSSMRKSGARTLLMGGQACVFYGAAEFSRDLDLLILADAANFERLHIALADLNATSIAVPPFEAGFLSRGHAVHFRCQRDDVKGLHIDLMSVLRTGAHFEEMWDRRTTIEVEGEPVDLMAREDLVNAKKTQRNKDWPMIGRLMERSYFTRDGIVTPEQAEFWLRELRTAELLIEAAVAWPEIAQTVLPERPAVRAAVGGDVSLVAIALEEEERAERYRDREYWQPLKRELEQARRRGTS
jgi:hypothetical protein